MNNVLAGSGARGCQGERIKNTRTFCGNPIPWPATLQPTVAFDERKMMTMSGGRCGFGMVDGGWDGLGTGTGTGSGTRTGSPR